MGFCLKKFEKEPVQTMTILCVDDHPVIVRGLKNSVKRIFPEATILAFTVAGEALEYAQNHGCDVLLCEIELYNYGGISLAEQIRRINPCVNIIFVTVCSETEHAKEVLKLRPSGYLTKPITETQLAAELQQLRYPVVCCFWEGRMDYEKENLKYHFVNRVADIYDSGVGFCRPRLHG